MTINTLESIYYIINIITVLLMFAYRLGYEIGKSERK